MRVKKIVAFILVSIICSNMVVHAEDQNIETDTNEKEESFEQTIITENYEITVPEENFEYLIYSGDEVTKEDKNVMENVADDTILEGDTIALYTTNDLTNECFQNDNVIVESNISFGADTEDSTSMWMTEDAVQEIKKDESEWNYQMIHADRAVDVSQDTVKVAVMDSGVDFLSNINVTKSINLVEDELDITDYMNDMTGHGTAVASIINTINPDAEIYSVKVLDSQNQGTLARIVKGIYWCIDNDVDIINMSFSTSVNSEILYEAMRAAEENGILLIASAGNSGNEGVEYPAKYEEVIAVGAVDNSGEITDISSVGEEVELVAPGQDILVESMLGLYTSADGTSMAAAHATGEASLLYQRDKNKSAEFIRFLMNDSARELGDNNVFGNGLVDVSYALDNYDMYSESYSQVGDGIQVGNNTASIDTFSDEEVQLEARWRSDEHLVLVTYWTEDYVADGVLSERCVKALKKGAVYPDVGQLESTIYHGARKANYLASYKYITALAKTMRTSYNSRIYPTRTNGLEKETFDTICNAVNRDITFDKIMYEGGYVDWNHNRVLGECDYNRLYSAGKTTAIARLKSFFIYGIALHALSDTYSHASYMKVNGVYMKIVHHDSVEGKSVLGAHEKEVAPKRWVDCVYAAQKLIDKAVAGKAGIISDFAPHVEGADRGYYLDQIIDKAYAIKSSSTYKTLFQYIDYNSTNAK